MSLNEKEHNTALPDGEDVEIMSVEMIPEPVLPTEAEEYPGSPPTIQTGVLLPAHSSSKMRKRSSLETHPASTRKRITEVSESRKKRRISKSKSFEENINPLREEHQSLSSFQVLSLPSSMTDTIRSGTLVRTNASIAPSTLAPMSLLDLESGTAMLVMRRMSSDRPDDSARTMISDESHHESGRHVADQALLQVLTAKSSAPAVRRSGTAIISNQNQTLPLLNTRATPSNRRSFRAANNEVGLAGGAWRGILKRFLVITLDDVNALRFSRGLQLFLPFLTAYEAYVLSLVIDSMDGASRRQLWNALSLAFQNRNVSRILVQQLFIARRYDFLFHTGTMITWNRWFDLGGQFPLLGGIVGFPATENFPSTRNHALASIFRIVLGEGNWLTRVITRGREGLITDNPNNTAQNLAAESNGFELANRNQYGTYVGRIKTNEFRLAHRLPTDESIVRTFVAQPMPTMLNNGVVHLLRQLAKHWHNMLQQQNFAHQRMEQLDPFEALRFHMPSVLTTLSSLRGRNKWDAHVLGPMIRKLQSLKPEFVTADEARSLSRELLSKIVVPVSGGVSSISDPLKSWVEAIEASCDGVEEEAKKVYGIVSSVEIGIRFGHDLISKVRWKIPADSILIEAILKHIRGLRVETRQTVEETRIRTALSKMTPRDKRTLIELVKIGLVNSRPAQLLLGRAKTLLQRELRRGLLNETILSMSKGEYLPSPSYLEEDKWYLLDQDFGRSAVYRYEGKKDNDYTFVHVNSNTKRTVSLSPNCDSKVRLYIPVAESISRAQRAFMNIELDHGKRYSYNAFMEFSYLRPALRKLIVISQLACEELDNARLNVLAEVQRSKQAKIKIDELVPGMMYYKYDKEKREYIPFKLDKPFKTGDAESLRLAKSDIRRVPPQSIIMVGGGPTGLMTTIHCTENVLLSGGEMKLFEARDAFSQGGSTFERAQIVRLDARWIAMMRYHLGTGFEDVYIPASGETDSQLGNTLPTQNFVEITIKDLEGMLHEEVARMWSKGLIQVHTQSQASYDHESNSLTKLGKYLKLNDRILRHVDNNGRFSIQKYSWKVVDLIETKALTLDKIKVGQEYGIFVRLENTIRPYRLAGVDLESGIYSFMALHQGHPDLKIDPSNMPSVYPKRTTRHANVYKVVVQCSNQRKDGTFMREELLMKHIENDKFTLDVGQSHVLEAIGKPHGSKVHLCVTTQEPYGVCCIQGLKISMGMHNFGERRWKNGILDDFRSQNDQNTRIIGDFTKMVRSKPVADKMLEYMTDKVNRDWQLLFESLVAESEFPELNTLDPVVTKIQRACRWFAMNVGDFRRKTLQTRFFETGDNYYLGMELMREYDLWKNELGDSLVAPLMEKVFEDTRDSLLGLRSTFMHYLDRLWYEAVLEVIRTGDVYNPGARRRVPRLYLIDSCTDVKLGSLPVGESFRVSSNREERYEIIIKRPSHVLARNVEGLISKMHISTIVRREGNLTRSPNGNAESKVALSTFPVAHYVNFRTMRLNDSSKGYVFAFIGDEQATPHFMRYSGLTGSCINAMMFNTFIKQAIDGIPFVDRFREYSIDTNWSNGEVVQRGTGANYGDGGFLRPGFPYTHVIDYLHSKVIEHQESEQDLDNVLSRDWMTKIASSMVPRGMELNNDFVDALTQQLQNVILNKFLMDVRADKRIRDETIEYALKARAEVLVEERSRLDRESYWRLFISGLSVDTRSKRLLEDGPVSIAVRLEQLVLQIIDFAKKAYLYNERVSSELYNQPKPVDSIVDDFAVEAQSFANALAMSAAFSSGVLAFRLVDDRIADIFSLLLTIFNILIAFGTMTNAARYKIRNEEARIMFADDKFSRVIKVVFGTLSRKTQDAISLEQNPFFISLEKDVNSFLKTVKYYDAPDPSAFIEAYNRLKMNIHDPVEIRVFQRLLATVFIADTYHVNSYVQESIVRIYKTTEEMHRLYSSRVDKIGESETLCLFNRLLAFQPKLERSLQRGPTRFGFVKQRKLSQWDIIAVLKYFWSLICCSSRRFRSLAAPIATETLGIVKATRHVAQRDDRVILNREIRDLDVLYWATRESDIGSLIFMSSFLVLVASIYFIIARASGIDLLLDIAFWAVTASGIGAALAVFHFWRKLLILVRLMWTLSRKARSAREADERENIRLVRGVTFTQVLLTLTRLLFTGAAAVALPWSIVEQGFGDKISIDSSLSFWIALGAVSGAVGSTFFFFLVEFVVRYNLSPRLGEFVCESFRDELEELSAQMAVPMNDIDTKQVQERETWEYVAREFLHRYRFDTVFAADRFGSILQYIQSGCDPRECEV